MKKFTVILIISLLLTGNAYAKVKSKDITFPGKFYTKEIKSCSALPDKAKFSNAETFKTIEDVIGYDWAKFHTETGTSLIVNHNVITVPGKLMLTALQHAFQTTIKLT